MRLARTATTVADGLYSVIPTEEYKVLISASPSKAARETWEALAELTHYDDLLAESWRGQLRLVSAAIEQFDNVHDDAQVLRSARALAATAALESALAARFEARLLGLPAEELWAIGAELELCFASVRDLRAEASAHLESAAEKLLDGLRAQLAGGANLASARTLRYEERLADDLASAMRGYADRIEQLLLDLGEVARVAVGLRAGGLLPTRQSRVAPRSDLPRVAEGDAARLPDELSTFVGHSIDLFRERLSRQVEEAIEILQGRVDRAVQCHALGQQGVCQRVEELGKIAHRMSDLADTMEWMPLDGG